ncbi:Ubiquitin carboxyl-terminal hydrolase isozyme L5 [Lachnellula occidentalis]|uniref:Ubiquitin carboxyl-terminal hydrolase n=1 Tax=Lachnellula occidentalis TaxID=215460 RepID=A0A8H8RZR9_9HELO|nr:Ubiquitin carboxyl-terminal hydrolase isozyme L5 [Lachnellula occidentalis]
MAQDLHMEDVADDQRTTSEEERRRSSKIGTVSSTPSEPTGKNIPQKRGSSSETTSSPKSTRILRPHNRDRQNGSGADAVAEAMMPLTDEERRNWTGWVELESDPALFNFILRENGVEDARVQEVLSLDTEMLAELPQPIYGFIFLFRYRDEDDEIEAEDPPKCPRHVWFANQTTSNACATVALLNIVMNVPEINLGEALASFKQNTQGLKPAYRGQRLSQNDSIRYIHNSFARRMDMLNADLGLQNDFEKWEKSKRNPKRKKVTNSNRKKKKDEEESGFHFIAYVPINGSVWRLDGLQRHPVNLGTCGDDWIAVARAHINERLHQNDQDDIQFSLLSLCKNPLQSIRQQVAENLNLIMSIEESLENMKPDWRAFTLCDKVPKLDESREFFGLSQEIIDEAKPPASALKNFQLASMEASSLIKLHEELLREQMAFRGKYMVEEVSIGHENGQAAKRKQDCSPRIYNSMKELAEAGVMKEIVQDIRENKDTK